MSCYGTNRRRLEFYGTKRKESWGSEKVPPNYIWGFDKAIFPTNMFDLSNVFIPDCYTRHRLKLLADK
jgi:hypothetical protein